jgi:hypothetical protein
MGQPRDGQGRFAVGNPGGPGRPRRAVERDYLTVLSDAVSRDDWRCVVQAAVESAKQGDAKARDWLTRYLIGDDPLTLTDLAADEAWGFGSDDDIERILAPRKAKRDSDERLRKIMEDYYASQAESGAGE